VWPEAAPEVPAYAASLWLTEPTLLAQAVSLRDAVLGNAGSGGAPFGPQNLFDVAMRGAGHAGTALLLCHLVTKAFARGGNAVTWRVVDRDGGTFNDGVRIHRPVAATSDGTMPAFYALLAASSLGVDDTGDWYRFFALAAAALLAASGGCLPPQPLPDGAALGFARRVDLIVHDLHDPALADNGAYRGWRWANGLSFTEFALWGRSESRTNMAARIGVAAAAFGLRMAGALPDPAWRWAVPRAGGWRWAANEAPAPIATLLTPADGLAA
jgi:hypothetical protein